MPGRSTLLIRHRRDYAVYWRNPVANDDGGVTVDPGVEIKVRWQNKQVQFTDPHGEIKISRAVIELGQEVDLGGFLWKGELADLPSGAVTNPFLAEGEFEILQTDYTANVNMRRVDRRAFL